MMYSSALCMYTVNMHSHMYIEYMHMYTMSVAHVIYTIHYTSRDKVTI